MPEPLVAAELSERRRRGTELLRASNEPGPPLAVLSTFNLDLLPPYMAEALERHGVPAALWTAGFDQLAREVADPGSELYARAPRDVLLVPAPEDLLAPLFAPEGVQDPDGLVDERLAELRGQVQTVLERLPAATVHLVCLSARRAPGESVLAPGSALRGQAPLERFDAGVRDLAALGARVVVADFAWAARDYGWAALADARLWYLGRMRLSATGHALLADVVARGLAAQRGIRRTKVLALDLDDTLWGGVVGEVGPEGVTIGVEGIGLAFADLQRELLRLHQRGVLLVMCTKNDPGYALAAFDRREMILRREHFAAERVDWRDKATNLREMADELGLGLDAFVLLDDNPREREWVRQALPEVVVPELPEDPVERPAFVARLPSLATLAVTDDDRRRSASYRAQRDRRRAQGEARSFEDYLASLEERVTIEPVTERTLPRAAQLCQKTNQFNLLTRRHTHGDLERMLADPACDLLTISVADRFGDSGITGVAIVRVDGQRADIDTLLLSCRVLGRRVEDALLSVLARRARERGARTLRGTYVPTERNGQVATFYRDRGFAPDGDDAWTLDLEQSLPATPEAVTVEEVAHA